MHGQVAVGRQVSQVHWEAVSLPLVVLQDDFLLLPEDVPAQWQVLWSEVPK